MKLRRKSQSWQKVYKTFKLIEFLIINGSSRIVQSIKDELGLIKSYSNYRLIEKGDDKGRGGKQSTDSWFKPASNLRRGSK